ncbi:unnamed protein product [Brassica rapa subsp. trilocularis]
MRGERVDSLFIRAEFQFVKVEDRGRGQDDCLKELEAQRSTLRSQLKITLGSLSVSKSHSRAILITIEKKAVRSIFVKNIIR